MSVELLLREFDRITEAPDAVGRLRRFVLDLAVRGRLVRQDPNDEPAQQLIARLAVQPGRRVMRRNQPVPTRRPDTPDVAEDMMPYDVPHSWEWACFSEVAVIRSHLVDPAEFGDSPHIAPDNIETRTGKLLPFRTVRESSVSSGKHLFEAGCILYSKIRPALAKAVVVDFGGLCSADMYPIAPLIDRGYLHLYMLSDTFVEQSTRVDNRVAMPKINQTALSNVLVAVPPLAEQRRIVAKVDELVALCDQMEAIQKEREFRRDQLRKASLQRLAVPKVDEPSTQADVRSFLVQSPRLITKPEHVAAVRRSIVDLAIGGQLGTGDPSDEPVHLGRGMETRLQTATGSRAAPVPIGKETRVGWKTLQLRHLLTHLQTGPFGSSLHQSNYVVGGTPVINPASLVGGRIVPLPKMAVGPETVKRLASFKLRERDIVVARRGEMGRCSVVTSNEEGWLCGTGSLILRFPLTVSVSFMALLIGSPTARAYLGGSAVGSTMQNLNQSILLTLPVGLPPLAEQRRIVAKVGELMAVCDELEAALAKVQTDRGRLLEALLQVALNECTGQVTTSTAVASAI